MSFAFNFDIEEEDDYSNSEAKAKEMTDSASTSPKIPSAERSSNKENEMESTILVSEIKSFFDTSILSKLETKTVLLNDCSLKIVDTSKLEHLMLTDGDFKASVCTSKTNAIGDIVSHSDLVDGIYEGGLKVWECGMDLAKYLSLPHKDSSIEIEGKRVLELGCGAGLPGLYCVYNGAKCVHFQDYNEEVIKILTHPNVESNKNLHPSQTPQPMCRYFAGDWGSFCMLKNDQTKYDLILSAETIYNADSYLKLHKVFDQMLAEDGIILLAAKVYYFGVGGSVEAFLDFLYQQNCFESKTIWETTTGVPRKILCLTRKHRISQETIT